MLTARNKVWLPWKLLKELTSRTQWAGESMGKDTNYEQSPAQVLALLLLTAGATFCPGPGESSRD